MATSGRFFGIGVGPGDPELLTLKAARLLAEVDWIFLPASHRSPLTTHHSPLTTHHSPLTTHHSPLTSYAGAIVASLHLDPHKFRPVTLCMSRERGADLQAYDRAAADIRTELRQGKSAAWITEGDPLFYSTFLHVMTALRRLDPDIAIDIVPGVTSIQAAAACVKVPIATLEERVAVVPAAYGLERLPELLEEFAVVFLLKVHGVVDQLLDRLALLPTPPLSYYVENAGTAEERIVSDLASLRGGKLPYFSLVILRRDPGRTL